MFTIIKRFLVLAALPAIALGLAACASTEVQPVISTETRDTPFGPMATYESSTGFAVDFPADWEVAAERDQRCGRAKLCYGSPRGAILILQEGQLGGPGLGDIGLSDYLTVMVGDFGRTESGFELTGREQITTGSGLPAEVLSYTSDKGAVTARELWTADGQDALTVSFLSWTENFEEIDELSRYVFDSVRPVEE